MLPKTSLLWPLPLIFAGILGLLHPVIIGAAVILALIPLIFISKRSIRLTGVGVPLILFAVSAVLGLWVSYDPALSWPFVVTLMGSLILFFIVANFENSIEFGAKGLVIASTLLAIYFVSQYAHFNYPYEMGRLARLARKTSVWTPDLVFFTPHPNAVAGFVSSTLLLNLALIWRARGMLGRVRWSVVALILGYALLITDSRGAWFGLAIATAVWAFLYFSQRAQHVLGLGVGLIIGMLLGAYVFIHFAPHNLHVPFYGSLRSTANSRLTLYHNSLNLLWDYPFTGIGPGDTFAMVYSRYQLLINVPYLEYAHNLFLAVGLGQGLLGLLALLWLMISFYRFVFRVERVKDAAVNSPIFRATWLGVTAIFLHGLTDAVRFSEARWTMPGLFVLLGIAVAAGGPVLKTNRRSPLSSPAFSKWAAPAVTTLVLLLLCAIYWRPLASAWYANLGAVYQTKAELSPTLADDGRRQRLRQARLYFEQALALNPKNSTAHRRLGMMALDQADFETAVAQLEQAYQQEPDNQATLKALGYAYLWSGQLEPAMRLLRRVNFRSRLLDELKYWRWQWGQQQREPLAARADEMLRRLTGGQ